VSYADLYTYLPATLHQQGRQATKAHVGLFWNNTHPAEIQVGVSTGRDMETWRVGRDLFIATDQTWSRGSWMGGGDFGVCFAGERVMLAFKPHHSDEKHAIVILPAQQVTDFIAHSCALVNPGEAESAINLDHIEKALAQILDAG
jgi:hypothetical protein